MTFPKIDLFSFWFGFILATVFWLVILRISKLLPKMKKTAALNRAKKSTKQNTNREHNLRLYALRKAQTNHIASSLFPLGKVLIEPYIIAPPDFIPGIGDEESDSSIVNLLPYTPEVPELYVGFHTQRISIRTLINSCLYVCLIGAPGSGKTTAISSLVSKLAENESDFLPVFLPSDLLVQPDTPIINLFCEYITSNVRGTTHESVEEIIASAAQSSRLMWVTDDLDELSKEDFDKAVVRIKELQTMYPSARIIVTAGSYYTGQLEENGFSPFTLAPWTQEERTLFVRNWVAAFFDANKASFQEDPIANKSRMDKAVLWLLQEDAVLSPLENTIKVWLSLANSLRHGQREKLLSSYLEFISDSSINQEGFIAIAELIEKTNSRSIGKEQVIELLNSHSDFIIRDESRRMAAVEIVETLIGNKLLTLNSDDSLEFSHIAIEGYLRSLVGSSLPLPSFSESLTSSLRFSCLVNKTSKDTALQDFISWLEQDDLPLFRNFLIGMNWLIHTSPGDQLRNEVFKRSAKLLQDTNLPFGLRSRFLTHLAQSQDPSILSLLTILKGNRDPIIRRLVALGFGMFDDEKAVAGLVDLSNDESIEVQNMAVLSLSRLWTVPTQDALANVIFNADEIVRSNACELLSHHKPVGHEMLKEIMATDNYLSRKAAISGLRRIDEPWVREILEKVSVEDNQWVVRDAAINALDHLSENKDLVPVNWLPVHENPWTMEKSEEYHLELSARSFPLNLLMTVFLQGSNQDRLIALHYLLAQPTPELILQLNKFSRQAGSPLRDHALNALFSLGRRGLEVR